jgi:hypothetical protein
MILKKKLFSASKLSNFIKNDQVLDYLNKLDENGFMVNSDLNIVKKRKFEESNESIESNKSCEFNKCNQKKKIKTSFDYIMSYGNQFENEIIQQIKHKMKLRNQLNKLISVEESNKYLNCDKTIKIISENRHNIILNSMLINPLDGTWGKPDLIVRGDWIQTYIPSIKINSNVISSKWYIIDIKSSTINLIAKGEELSSKLLYSVYKSQIYIYTNALNVLLNKNTKISNNVKCGFILGKRYKYVLNKNIIIKNTFDFVATIDFNKEYSKGIIWNNIISKAVKWHKYLDSNWKKLQIKPINNDVLYPNMKNTLNGNTCVYNIKKNIAQYNKEITLLWNCGLLNRKLAWSRGIKHYDDPKLNSSILGFSNSNKELIINSMLSILHSNNNFILNKKNNLFDWQTIATYEFFVDFETFNLDIDVDNSFPQESDDYLYISNQQIYMIGISFLNLSNIFVHYTFIINHPSFISMCPNNKINSDYIYCSDEKDLIIKFSVFIFQSVQQFFSINSTNLYKLFHWSNAEPLLFEKKLKQYKLEEEYFKFNWVDLLKIFKHNEYPIIIKECFGFGLKEIIKKLNYYKEIDLVWSELDDGLLSSFLARDIYLNISNDKMTININSIIEYNMIDCKALYCILEWMRKKLK